MQETFFKNIKKILQTPNFWIYTLLDCGKCLIGYRPYTFEITLHVSTKTLR